MKMQLLVKTVCKMLCIRREACKNVNVSGGKSYVLGEIYREILMRMSSSNCWPKKPAEFRAPIGTQNPLSRNLNPLFQLLPSRAAEKRLTHQSSMWQSFRYSKMAIASLLSLLFSMLNFPNSLDYISVGQKLEVWEMSSAQCLLRNFSSAQLSSTSEATSTCLHLQITGVSLLVSGDSKRQPVCGEEPGAG